MNAHNNREYPRLIFWTVYIENLPLCILPIHDIVKTPDSLRCGETGIPPVIPLPKQFTNCITHF